MVVGIARMTGQKAATGFTGSEIAAGWVDSKAIAKATEPTFTRLVDFATNSTHLIG